ncbi:MAG: hypothetical protein K0R83_2031 [Caulobacter sp.]|jgi:protein required for attachment to host cells|nr:hypothetical protein [Caulobacter sp.]
MIPDGRTLILVADGRRARLFEEARRGGSLTEHAAWLADLFISPTPAHGWRGGGEKAEAGFLTRLAHRLDALFTRHRFDHLILIAAPRSLGQLRRHLAAGLKARLELSDPHDRLAASLDDIQQTVRALRRVNA